MKRFSFFFSLVILFLAVLCASADAYLYLSVSGSNVSIRAEAKMNGKVLTQAKAGDVFIAEDKQVTNEADGSKWFKIVLSLGNDYELLKDDGRFGIEAAYISVNNAHTMRVAENENKKIASLLAGAASVSASSATVTDAATGTAIKVSNSREFLEALGSDRIIEMAPGKYNLSEWDPFLNNQPEQAPPYPNLLNDSGIKYAPGVSWEETFGGGELVLSEIENLTIRSPGENRSSGIIVDPRYAFVLKFVNCSGITIENLTAGHSEGGYCTGGVFGFEGSKRITITGSNMYGCGTEGLVLMNVSDMRVTASRIYECTYDIMTVDGGSNIAFDSCVFNNNEEFSLVNVFGTRNISFAECEFTGNHGSNMFSVHDTTVSVQNSAFSGNTLSSPVQGSDNVEFVNCTFADAALETILDTTKGEYAFITLCGEGALQQILSAIESGANVNAKNEYGWTPLLIAAANNKDALVSSALIQAGADVNASNDGWTSLIRAVCFNENPEVTSVLIQAGADIHAKNNYGKTALEYAIEDKNEKIIELLTRADTVPSMTDSDFVDLCAEGSLEQIVQAVKNGANVNARGSDNEMTPLMTAAWRSDEDSTLEIIAVLIEAGADVNARNVDGMTPLMWTAHRVFSPEVSKALIEAGADVSARCDFGNTALIWAEMGASSPEIVTVLVNAGVDVNASNSDKYTALMYAAGSNPNTGSAINLIKAGANVNASGNDGQTPLIQAARWTLNPEMITTLLNNGADPKMKDNSGKTAIDYAKENENLINTDALRELEGDVSRAETAPPQEGNGDEKIVGEVRLIDNNTGNTKTLYPPFSEEDKGLLFYHNDRYGYAMSIPDIFTEVVLLPGNEDGLILGSKNGEYRFRASGGFVVFEDELQKSMEAAKKYVEEYVDGAIIYEKTGDDWWELNWWNGPEKGVRKFMTNGEAWCECEITSPGKLRNEQGEFDELFERSLATMSFPVG